MATPETVTVEFSIAADSKTGNLRLIVFDPEIGATYVYDSIRDFLSSHAEFIYDTNIFGSIDEPEGNKGHEEDHRRFRVTTTIEQIA